MTRHGVRVRGFRKRIFTLYFFKCALQIFELALPLPDLGVYDGKLLPGDFNLLLLHFETELLTPWTYSAIGAAGFAVVNGVETQVKGGKFAECFFCEGPENL